MATFSCPDPSPPSPAAYLAHILSAAPEYPGVSQDVALAAAPVASFIDRYAPSKQMAPAQSYSPEGWEIPNAVGEADEPVEDMPTWTQRATNAVCHAIRELKAASVPPSKPLILGRPWAPGPCSKTLGICNRPVGPTFSMLTPPLMAWY